MRADETQAMNNLKEQEKKEEKKEEEMSENEKKEREKFYIRFKLN